MILSFSYNSLDVPNSHTYGSGFIPSQLGFLGKALSSEDTHFPNELSAQSSQLEEKDLPRPESAGDINIHCTFSSLILRVLVRSNSRRFVHASRWLSEFTVVK